MNKKEIIYRTPTYDEDVIWDSLAKLKDYIIDVKTQEPFAQYVDLPGMAAIRLRHKMIPGTVHLVIQRELLGIKAILFASDTIEDMTLMHKLSEELRVGARPRIDKKTFDAHELSDCLLLLLGDITGIHPRDINTFDSDVIDFLTSSDESLESLGLHMIIARFGLRKGYLKAMHPQSFDELARALALAMESDAYHRLILKNFADETWNWSDIIATEEDLSTFLRAHGESEAVISETLGTLRYHRRFSCELEQMLSRYSGPIAAFKKYSTYLFSEQWVKLQSLYLYRLAYYKVHHSVDYDSYYKSLRSQYLDPVKQVD